MTVDTLLVNYFGDGDGDGDGDKSVDGDGEHDGDSEVLPQQLWFHGTIAAKGDFTTSW